MSSTPYAASEPAVAGSSWLLELLGVPECREGDEVTLRGTPYTLRGGILRVGVGHSAAQEQTSEAFGFKWQQRSTFEGDASLARTRAWLVERYGNVAEAAWWREYTRPPVVVDAGCGAGVAGLALFQPLLDRIRYVGVDVSAAVDVAAARFQEQGLPGGFLQADLTELPFPDASVDVLFSEGVLHHTDSTERALHAVARVVRPGGRVLFYVYRRKGPIREFTDDYVRDKLQSMSPPDAWDAVMPLTLLGQALGDLGVVVDVPEDIPLLEIPAGPIDIQRLFYWHVVKAFAHPDLDVEELNHINYDWFAPANAHRQSVEEVRAWCDAADLDIEHEDVQDAGITVIARRRT